MTTFYRTLIQACPAALACVITHGAEPNFNRDVRPILSENCFLCHGYSIDDHRDMWA